MSRYKIGETIKKIFSYDNYRSFLNDYFSEQKTLRKAFTQRFFAQKAGFNSHNFCPLVIKGVRNLSLESIEKIVEAIPLKGIAADYFRVLVRYNQAESFDDKQEEFKHLKALREKTKFHRLDDGSFPFFSRWYMPVVRVLAACSNWGGDFRKLAQMVYPPITMDEARSAVKDLVEIKLLIDKGNGRYALSADKLTTEGMPPIIRNKNRHEILLQSIYNTEALPPDQRYLAYSTLGTSEKTFKKITEYLDTVRLNIIDMVMADDTVEKTYELNINMVPFSSRFEYNGGEEARNACVESN
jgi:uncharacterized protein (TIGR02147 family)